MKLNMREEDRRAIDILLDRSAQAAGKPHGSVVYAGAASGHLRERIARVEKVLGLLDNMTVSDPPRDLISQTLQFIDQAAQGEMSGRRIQPPSYSQQPPVA